MKLLLLAIFLTTYTFAQTCTPEFKNQQIKLLSLYNSQVLAQEARCATSQSDGPICSLEEAKQKYNQALAKLVLAKGLDALKQDLEVSYSQIQNLSSKKLKEAIASVDSFETALIKTEVLSESLKFKDKKRIVDLSEDENMDVEKAINSSCSTAEAKATPYCKSLTSLTASQKAATIKFMEGFVETFDEAYPDQRDHDPAYTNLQKKLKFEINGKPTDIQSFRGTTQYSDVQKIKENLKALLVNKDSKKAKEIVTLSGSLKNLKAEFGNNSYTVNKVIEEIRDSLQQDLSSISSAYAILTKAEPVKDNINSTIKLIDAQTKIRLKSLQDDVKKDHSADCKNRDFNECMSYLKQNTPDAASSVLTRQSEILETDKFKAALIMSKNCMADKKDNIEKAQCIEEVKKRYANMFSSDIGQLELDLETAKNNITKASKNEIISTLEQNKILALTALKENGCLQDTTVSINCNNSNSFDTATLNLSSDTENVIAQLSLKDYKQLNKTTYIPKSPSEETDSIDSLDVNEKGNQRELAKTEEEGQFNTALSRDQKRKLRKSTRNVKRATRYENRQLRWDKNDKKYSQPNDGSNFFSGFSNSLSMGVPQIMAQSAQRSQIRAERLQRQQYYDYYITSLKNYNANGYGNGLYMNWGSNAYNPYYANDFNHSNSHLYYGANYPQYTYGSSNIGNNYFDTSGGASASGNTNNSFSFGF